jgi:hypothetical protein
MSEPGASGVAGGTDRDGEALPALETVRPRTTTEDGDPAVEIRFSNGAKIRYRAAGEAIEEEWFDPDGDEAARSHIADLPAAHAGGDDSTDGGPTTSELADRALCTIASYLSFEGRRRAAFTWGEENVAVLTGENGTTVGE